ncbi:hypothetical protein YC2023_083529 [Brassica napus]
MASVMGSDGETEEDVSADLTSVLSEEFHGVFFYLFCYVNGYYFSLPASGEAPDLNDTKVRPKNPSSRRKEVVDAKERSSIGDLNNFLSNFNDQLPNRLPTKFKSARIVESLSQKTKMAGTICLALAAAKKLNRSPASLRCKPATNVLITMSPVL